MTKNHFEPPVRTSEVAVECARHQESHDQCTRFALQLSVRRLLEQERAHPFSTARDADAVMRFRELVEKHYRDHPPLDFYARKLGVTTARLNACCRVTTGKSSLALINDRLLTEAKRNLLYSDMTVSEIGAALGYGDPAYFNRFFSRGVGLSPGRFRDSQPARPPEVKPTTPASANRRIRAPG